MNVDAHHIAIPRTSVRRPIRWCPTGVYLQEGSTIVYEIEITYDDGSMARQYLEQECGSLVQDVQERIHEP